jgi:hypothetical protein
MLMEEIYNTFKMNAIKCGSHKRILKDLVLFDEEMDLDNLKQIDFLDKSIDLLFELNEESNLLVSLPQYYPFKSPEFFIISDQGKTEVKKFVYQYIKDLPNFSKEDIEKYFSKLNDMLITHKPTVKLHQLIDEIMNILRIINIGWYID